MTIDKDVSQRIEILRFLMIFGVMVLHVPLYVSLNQLDGSAFEYVKAFFQHGLFRTTTPVLTFVSGYLLFGADLDKKPFTLGKKKFNSLLVPFVVFNFSMLAIAYFAQRKLGLTMSYDLLHANLKTWLNASIGLEANPIDYPLNFLRDMIVLMFLAPLFGYLLRVMPVLGLISVLYVFLNNYDGLLLLRDTMGIQFYLGGLCAIYKFNMKTLDVFAKQALFALVGICLLMVKFKIENRTGLVLAAPLLVWPAASLLVNTRVGKWIADHSNYSFFIFLAHAPFLIVSWTLYNKFQQHIPYAVYWVATPLVTTFCLMVIYKLGMRIMPTTFDFILGCRRHTVRPVFVDRRSVSRPAGAPVYSHDYRMELLNA